MNTSSTTENLSEGTGQCHFLKKFFKCVLPGKALTWIIPITTDFSRPKSFKNVMFYGEIQGEEKYLVFLCKPRVTWLAKGHFGVIKQKQHKMNPLQNQYLASTVVYLTLPKQL